MPYLRSLVRKMAALFLLVFSLKFSAPSFQRMFKPHILFNTT